MQRAPQHLTLPADFRDTDGAPINAHGGGLLHHRGIYYWVGEYRTEGPASFNARVGISCYSSPDLVHWRNEGIILPVSDIAGHPLESGCKMERPKLVHCPATDKFVLWWHHDRKGWGHHGALAGIAIADAPTGPFEFLHVFRPHGAMFRDCTVFRDDDGIAYLVFASDDNANLAICQLEDDYVTPAPRIQRVFPGRYMEAPCVFKRSGQYYMIASDCTSWHPNEARSAVAPTIWGPWLELGNPCLGPGAEITYGSQGTYVLPVAGFDDCYLFMADRWNPNNLIESTYLWLPIHFRSTIPDRPERPFIRAPADSRTYSTSPLTRE